MVINWYGLSCFKIQSGTATAVFNPFSKLSGLTPPKGEGSILLVSLDEPSFNNISTLKAQPFVVDGPGEYEHQGIRIRGIATYGPEAKKINTAYLFETEDMRLLHLGALSQERLSDEQIEQIGNIDILIIPTGGGDFINAEQAIEIINQIEPSIVIPSHFKTKGVKEKLDGAEVFLKQIGQKDVEPKDKLTVKKKDIPIDRMEVVVLKV